jgi:hypothetical protein
MRKRYSFNSEEGWDWPTPESLKPFFLAPPGKRWFFETENDGGLLAAEGVENTQHLRLGAGRIDIYLEMYGHPELGVCLLYEKTGGKNPGVFSSKGDVTRLREWVRTLHGDLRPVGLYIPYEKAWKAVEEFIKTDGQLPKSIEWIANRDLPPNTFPAPHEMKI